MRILADENFPRKAVEALRARGHDVLWVRTDCPGIADNSILARAQLENRVVVTFDKDFGELAFHSRLPALAGVILFRIRSSSPDEANRIIVSVIESRAEWMGLFATVENDRVRIRPLPQKHA